MSDKGLLLVTGGSRGIGAAVCRLASRDGWAVALTYRSAKGEAEAVAADIRRGGGTVSIHQCDTADRSSIAGLFGEIDALGIPLKGLANNAGIINPFTAFIDADPDRMERLYAVNLTGATIVLQEAAKRMAKSRGGQGGAIINTSSIASRLGGAGACVDYSASKAALDVLTFGLGRELASEGIRVNAVRPGIIETDIHSDTGNPNRVADLTDELPMKRAGSAEEVAETILFLLSERASYVSNALVDIGGGR
ncbi:SDR family oxidoreductase [Notoacmeibacter sp. MSK16QG-6]|uniref:SDR family oxidoreductase n=1 Tax=Notoacmeibacter sp. MSK16QG-6 TaxID=2957982 RepID=UPI0020A08725|nr:SDR family oxidoreductase [Notoacmeibacter sp. MSK16QG-6]MCP1199193.1 SDR family oxidoreductase [Notoacmeibacter sp. MSK16QG-6]